MGSDKRHCFCGEQELGEKAVEVLVPTDHIERDWVFYPQAAFVHSTSGCEKAAWEETILGKVMPEFGVALAFG